MMLTWPGKASKCSTFAPPGRYDEAGRRRHRRVMALKRSRPEIPTAVVVRRCHALMGTLSARHYQTVRTPYLYNQPNREDPEIYSTVGTNYDTSRAYMHGLLRVHHRYLCTTVLVAATVSHKSTRRSRPIGQYIQHACCGLSQCCVRAHLTASCV